MSSRLFCRFAVKFHVFDFPAAYGVGFDPQGTVKVRAVHRAVLGEDIPGASRHFTAYDRLACRHSAFSEPAFLGSVKKNVLPSPGFDSM